VTGAPGGGGGRGDLVDQVLASRAGRSFARQRFASFVAAVVLHLLVAAAVIGLPKLAADERPEIDYVAVQLLPAPALGTRGTPAPAPAPVVDEPEPVVEEPAPEPEPPEPDVPVLPEPEADPPPPDPPAPTPEPRRDPPREETPPRRETPPATNEPPGPVGREGGEFHGSGRFGVRAVGADGSTFEFSYYLDQMLGQIERSWTRPPGEDLEALVSYRVLRDGRIVDVELEESSGSRSFDLSALRALRNASPLPRLPAAFRQDALEVNLIVR
jgi:TonB family protein